MITDIYRTLKSLSTDMATVDICYRNTTEGLACWHTIIILALGRLQVQGQSTCTYPEIRARKKTEKEDSQEKCVMNGVRIQKGLCTSTTSSLVPQSRGVLPST